MHTTTDFSALTNAVSERQSKVKSYLFEEENRVSFAYQHLEDAVYSYINAGGKALRSAVMMFCCGAVGGDENTAIPAAAAIELYHTFTLVHDDIIDRDEMRRGVPTVHHQFAQIGRQELHLPDETAQRYGLAIAILAGDMQMGWAASLLPDLHLRYGLPPELPLKLTKELFRKTQISLINGETVDIMQAETPIDALSEPDVLNMLWQKTGSLYEFAGRAGAAIGLRTYDLYDPTVQKLAEFAGKCGTAFQIQDDILGIVGNEQKLGKPIGSDIREGKRTVIVLKGYSLMDNAQKKFTQDTLGNPNAKDHEIQHLIGLLGEVGAIDYAHQLAEGYVKEALTNLEMLPNSPQKDLLIQWANYIIYRER